MSRFAPDDWRRTALAALILLGVFVAVAGLVLLFAWFGWRAVWPMLGLLSLAFATTVQSRRVAIGWAVLAGVLIHG